MENQEENTVIFDYESFQKQALEQLQEGKPLMGEKGIFAPLLKHFLEASLQGEMKNHLANQQGLGIKNRRNGKSSKKVKSLESGDFELDTPRDRRSDFEPKIVAKRQTIITEGLEEKVLSMYSRGFSYQDIKEHIAEIYGMSISTSELSAITDTVLPALQEWRCRPLESLYCFLFLDCMFCKIRKDGKVESRAVYNLIGINQEGKKEVLGLYLSETEGAKFWLSVLTDLKNRGVEDVLITCVDGLTGFPEAIQSVFPHTEIQRCIVHQIRNTMRYLPDKDLKVFLKDLKLVYQAVNEAEGFAQLEALEQKWGEKYPVAVRIWFDAWEHLSPFFAYSAEIRKVMYTAAAAATNLIEGFHRQLRKVTKTKGAFSSETALTKLLYVAIKRIEKKWTMPIRNWPLIFSQLYIRYEERVKPHLKY